MSRPLLPTSNLGFYCDDLNHGFKKNHDGSSLECTEDRSCSSDNDCFLDFLCKYNVANRENECTHSPTIELPAFVVPALVTPLECEIAVANDNSGGFRVKSRNSLHLDRPPIATNARVDWLKKNDTKAIAPGLYSMFECNYDYFDEDGEADRGSSYRWFDGDKLLSGSSKWMSASDYYSELRCEVTAVNYKSVGTASLSMNSWAIDHEPTVSNLRVDSPAFAAMHASDSAVFARVGDSLTCEFDYDDVDYDPITSVDVTWFNSTVHVIGTGKSLVMTKDTLVWRVFCTARVYNLKAHSALSRSVPIPVDHDPSVHDVKIATAAGRPVALLNHELTCRYTYFDIDGDMEIGTTFRWILPSGEVIGSSRKLLISDSEWTEVSCIVQAQNIRAIVDPIVSDSITIKSKPIVRDVYIDFDGAGGYMRAMTGTVVKCMYTYVDLDGDAQNLNGTVFKWYSMMEEIVGANAQDFTVTDETVTPLNCEVVVANDYSVSDLVLSAPMIVDKLPYTDEVTIMSAVEYAGVGDMLTCSYNYGDKNGDMEEGTSFYWEQVPSTNGSYPDLSIEAASMLKNHHLQDLTISRELTLIGVIRCGVTVANAFNVGDLVLSRPRPVDLPATASNVAIVPVPSKTNTYKCNYTYHDSDGDEEGIARFQWYARVQMGGDEGTTIFRGTELRGSLVPQFNGLAEVVIDKADYSPMMCIVTPQSLINKGERSPSDLFNLPGFVADEEEGESENQASFDQRGSANIIYGSVGGGMAELMESGTNGYSFGAWVNSDTSAGGGCLMSWGNVDTGALRSILVDAVSSTITLTNNDSPMIFANTGQSVHAWTHIVLSFTNDQAKPAEVTLYVNGALKESRLISDIGIEPSQMNADSIIYMGLQPVHSMPFNGMLDEISFWSKALTSADVGKLFNHGSPGDALEVEDAYSTLEAWFRFESSVSSSGGASRRLLQGGAPVKMGFNYSPKGSAVPLKFVDFTTKAEVDESTTSIVTESVPKVTPNLLALAIRVEVVRSPTGLVTDASEARVGYTLGCTAMFVGSTSAVHSRIQWVDQDDNYLTEPLYYKMSSYTITSLATASAKCLVTAGSEKGLGETFSSAYFNIDRVPTVKDIGLVTVKGTHRTPGSTVECRYTYEDADGDLEKGSNIDWYSVNMDAGPNDPDYLLAGEQGKYMFVREEYSTLGPIYCTVTPANEHGVGVPVIALNALAVDFLPIATNVRVESAVDYVSTGDFLMCNYDYTDEDGDAESDTLIRWFSPTRLISAYSSSNAQLLITDSLLPVHPISCSVKPVNAEGTGKATPSILAQDMLVKKAITPEVSNVLISVQNAYNPYVHGDASQIPTELSTLTCDFTFSGEPGDLGDNSVISWYVDAVDPANVVTRNTFAGVTIKGRRLTLSEGSELVGRSIVCQVIPKSPVLTGDAVSSPEASVFIDTKPVASNVVVLNTDGTDYIVEGSTLQCTYAFSDAEGDADSCSVIKWCNVMGQCDEASGIDLSFTMPAIDSFPGPVTCRVVPCNAKSIGLEVSSAPREVDTPPAVHNVHIALVSSFTNSPLSTSSPSVQDVVECRFTYSDKDGDPMGASKVEWIRAADDFVFAESTSDYMINTQMGGDWPAYCRITPVNAKGNANRMLKFSIVIQTFPWVCEHMRVTLNVRA